MDGLVGAVAAADSAWSIAAIFLIGLYVLGWRWGGKLIDRHDKDSALVKELAAERIAKVDAVLMHIDKRLTRIEKRLTQAEHDTKRRPEG